MEKLRNFMLAKSLGLFINLLSYTHPKKASLLAYRFFSEPRDGRLTRENLPQVLKDAVAETVSHNGHEFQTYIWKGNENVILLVHGWESNAARWEKFLPYLKRSGCTIVAIDGPAHGLSSGREFNIPVYAEFIDVTARKFSPKYLIGHSIGGAACVYYQYKYENAGLKKMVVLGAPSDLEVLISNYVTLLSLNTRMVKLLEDHFLEKFSIKLAEFSGKIFGKKLNVHGLIAHDVDDTVVAIGEGKKIAESWTNASFIQTKGLGHSMHDEGLYHQVSTFLHE
jgi:predicted alpha/beta hydrolase family esterase